MPQARNSGLVLAFAGIAALLLATLLAHRPTSARSAVAPTSVFSALRTMDVLRELVGSGVPHPIGSLDGARIRALLVSRLTALGYLMELQTGFVCNDAGVCGWPVNVIARRDRGSADEDAVLLSAHYDSVPAGPGASDDGAGVASVLEIARILPLRPPTRHPIILLLTEGEENGLLGALLFVQQHPLSRHVRAVVNLDARGTSGQSVMFETGTANSWVMNVYRSAIERPVTNSLYYVCYQWLPNLTDFTVYKAAGYQGLNFAFIDDVARYHTPLDDWMNADESSVQQQGDNALASILALADTGNLRQPAGESVYFDTFGQALVRWPAEASLPAALVALLLLLAESMILLRRKRLSGFDLIWGWVAIGVTVLLSVAATAGIVALLVACGKVPPLDNESWIAFPLPMTVAAASIPLLCAAVISTRYKRQNHQWGLWAASTMLVAIVAVVSAAVVPGASFLFLLSALSASVAAAPIALCAWTHRTPPLWMIDACALVPALVFLSGVLSILAFIYSALGAVAWPVSTLLLGLGIAMLMPLLSNAGRTSSQWVIAASAVLAVGGPLVTLGLPTYTAASPQRITFEYWLNVDTHTAYWLAQSASTQLPPTIASAAHFEAVPRPRFPGSASVRFFAVAPPLDFNGPVLTVERQALREPSPTAGVTHYQLMLRSARSAPEAVVVFPASANIREVSITTPKGPRVTKLKLLKSGASWLKFVGMPPNGVEFGVDVAGHSPTLIEVFDQSYDFAEGKFLQRVRPAAATSSQDGDLTVVHRTVSLDPAAGR